MQRNWWWKKKQNTNAKFCFSYLASYHQEISNIKLQPVLKLKKGRKLEKIYFSIRDPLKNSKHQEVEKSFLHVIKVHMKSWNFNPSAVLISVQSFFYIFCRNNFWSSGTSFSPWSSIKRHQWCFKDGFACLQLLLLSHMFLKRLHIFLLSKFLGVFSILCSFINRQSLCAACFNK